MRDYVPSKPAHCHDFVFPSAVSNLVTFCKKFLEGKCQEFGLCGSGMIRRRSIQKVCEDDRSHGMSWPVQEFCGIKLI